jgi:hypothetical protein
MIIITSNVFKETVSVSVNRNIFMFVVLRWEINMRKNLYFRSDNFMQKDVFYLTPMSYET